jgi:hypothetical protein
MSKSHSRRAVLAGIATSPALAAPALALSGSDPIFALIEEHRAALALCERANSDEDINAACDLKRPIEKALARTAPTTLAGVVAIMRYRRELDTDDVDGCQLFPSKGEGGNPGDEITSWLAVGSSSRSPGLRASTTWLRQAPAPIAAAGETDPIFALIELHRSALAGHLAASDAQGDMEVRLVDEQLAAAGSPAKQSDAWHEAIAAA